MYELLEQLINTGYFVDEFNLNERELKVRLKPTIRDYKEIEEIIKIIGNRQYKISSSYDHIYFIIHNKPKL